MVILFFQLRIGNSICNTTIRLSTLQSIIFCLAYHLHLLFFYACNTTHSFPTQNSDPLFYLLWFSFFPFLITNSSDKGRKNHQVDNLLVPSPNIKDQDFVNSKRGFKGKILFPTLYLIYIYYFFLSQVSSLLCI